LYWLNSTPASHTSFFNYFNYFNNLNNLFLNKSYLVTATPTNFNFNFNFYLRASLNDLDLFYLKDIEFLTFF
jgi:hypothetical protein